MVRPKKPAAPDHSWWWIGGSFALGAGLLAVAGGVVIPPLVGAILWLLALAMLVIGAWRFGRLARVAAALVGGFVAFSLWHTTSPHADVRFIGTPQITVDPATGVITGRVHYENRGAWSARMRPVSAIWVGHERMSLEDAANRNADEALEVSLVLEEIGPESESRSYETQHKSKHPVESYSRPDGTTIVLAARIAYSDWWPFEEVARLCVFVPPGTNRIAYCSKGTDGMSRRSGQ